MALVGESGSGKSTLGNLVTGLFEPQSGQILIDGYSLRSWGRERLSNIVASVDQDIRLFSGSGPLHDNVTRRGRHCGARSSGRRRRRCMA